MLATTKGAHIKTDQKHRAGISGNTEDSCLEAEGNSSHEIIYTN